MRRRLTKGIKNIVVKVGTSVLTQNGRFDRLIVERLADQISTFLKKGIRVSIVSSGAIGGGMTILKMKQRPKTMEGLQGAAAVGQRYLMQCYEEAFSKRGFSTAQVLLTWDDLSEQKRFLNAKRTLKEIQKWGLVPVINENDTVATDEIRFGDNDRLSSLLAILVEADVHVILSDTNGLFSGDQRHPANRIRIVDKMERPLFLYAKDSKNPFTIGGMRSKLSAISMSVTSGIPVFLANGRDDKVLTRIFDGEDVGTLFLPNLKSGHTRRDWLKHFLAHVKNPTKS